MPTVLQKKRTIFSGLLKSRTLPCLRIDDQGSTRGNDRDFQIAAVTFSFDTFPTFNQVGVAMKYRYFQLLCFGLVFAAI